MLPPWMPAPVGDSLWVRRTRFTVPIPPLRVTLYRHVASQRETLCALRQSLIERREAGSPRAAREVQRIREIEPFVEGIDCHQRA